MSVCVRGRYIVDKATERGGRTKEQKRGWEESEKLLKMYGF